MDDEFKDPNDEEEEKEGEELDPEELEEEDGLDDAFDEAESF